MAIILGLVEKKLARQCLNYKAFQNLTYVLDDLAYLSIVSLRYFRTFILLT